MEQVSHHCVFGVEQVSHHCVFGLVKPKLKQNLNPKVKRHVYVIGVQQMVVSWHCLSWVKSVQKRRTSQHPPRRTHAPPPPKQAQKFRKLNVYLHLQKWRIGRVTPPPHSKTFLISRSGRVGQKLYFSYSLIL